MLVTHSIAEAVFLGTRVEVMSPRPGRLVRTFDVSLQPDRNYAHVMADPGFGPLIRQIRQLLGSADAAANVTSAASIETNVTSAALTKVT